MSARKIAKGQCVSSNVEPNRFHRAQAAQRSHLRAVFKRTIIVRVHSIAAERAQIVTAERENRKRKIRRKGIEILQA